MEAPFLLYGSYGYTGRLIANLAVRRGMKPILAGRDGARLKAQADQLGLDYRQFSLDDQAALDSALGEVPLVLHCAGPFIKTYQPMIDACLRVGRHYLDITGEIPVFQALYERESRARESGVMVMPGVGFDVVPSDCLAAHLKRRLPGATYLTLSVSAVGETLTRGTQLSSIEALPGQCVVRKEGKLTHVPRFSKTRQVDYGYGVRNAVLFPWGDVFTAYHSTGIPNIEVYLAHQGSTMRMLRLLQSLTNKFTVTLLQRLLRRMVMRLPEGPSEEELRRGRGLLWGEVADNQGHKLQSRLETPQGYALTAETTLAIVAHVLGGDFKPGFQTPSLVYGADFILEFEGVRREDI